MPATARSNSNNQQQPNNKQSKFAPVITAGHTHTTHNNDSQPASSTTWPCRRNVHVHVLALHTVHTVRSLPNCVRPRVLDMLRYGGRVIKVGSETHSSSSRIVITKSSSGYGWLARWANGHGTRGRTRTCTHVHHGCTHERGESQASRLFFGWCTWHTLCWPCICVSGWFRFLCCFFLGCH